jgi:hypothetical protein
MMTANANTLLERALAMALEAHTGQPDKAGKVYILHPLRLMMQMNDDEGRLVALLHDVVEDSDITLAQLRQADFPDDVVTAIDCLTRREDESYDEFITRILPNRLACRVKLADIEDNMNLTRLTQLTPKDIERLERYMQARQRIMTVLSTSSPE